jgi:hypothetical protein
VPGYPIPRATVFPASLINSLRDILAIDLSAIEPEAVSGVAASLPDGLRCVSRLPKKTTVECEEVRAGSPEKKT